jgi:hypothetical protein
LADPVLLGPDGALAGPEHDLGGLEVQGQEEQGEREQGGGQADRPACAVQDLTEATTHATILGPSGGP